MEFIDLKAQYRRLQEPINEGIQKVLNHSRYVLGPEVTELENRLAEYVNASHCIAVSSGTDALLVALLALGVGEGDEVITTPFSFIATAEVIALLGASPVFVDIDRRTYNIDPALIPSAISAKTRAIMPVSLYGQCAAFDQITAIAKTHELPVIEDAAQSFGATYSNRVSCGLTDLAAASFFPSKPLGCYGDGGALFVSDDRLAGIAREIAAHGEKRRYHHTRIGINGRMDTLQAAILLAKFDYFDQEVEARARIARRYTTLIEDLFRGSDESVDVRCPYIASNCESVFAQYTIEVPDREAVQAKLSARGIPTAVHYPVPLHLQPVFKNLGLGVGSFPEAEAAARRVISLPMHPYLSDEDQDLVVAALKESVSVQ